MKVDLKLYGEEGGSGTEEGGSGTVYGEGSGAGTVYGEGGGSGTVYGEEELKDICWTDTARVLTAVCH